jgi:hypothetical protein
MYSLRQIKCVAYLKHGTADVVALAVERAKLRISSAKRKRQEQLASVFRGHIYNVADVANLELMDVCQRFIRNGTGGIRRVSRQLSLWCPFMREFKKCVNDGSFADHECYEEFERCIVCAFDIYTVLGRLMERSLEREGANARRASFDDVAAGIVSRLSDVYGPFDTNFKESEFVQVRQKYIDFENIVPFERLCRMHVLRQAIGDPAVCVDVAIASDFICGNDADLAATVTEVKEMDFLRSHTQYQQIHDYLVIANGNSSSNGSHDIKHLAQIAKNIVYNFL